MVIGQCITHITRINRTTHSAHIVIYTHTTCLRTLHMSRTPHISDASQQIPHRSNTTITHISHTSRMPHITHAITYHLDCTFLVCNEADICVIPTWWHLPSSTSQSPTSCSPADMYSRGTPGCGKLPCCRPRRGGAATARDMASIPDLKQQMDRSNNWQMQQGK